MKAMYVKMLPIPDVSKFKAGVICEAINPKDGKWQGGIIERLVERGFQVKYRKTGNKEVVSLYYLREARASAGNKRGLELTSMLEFKIPDHLKVLPNDSVEERSRKKKKLKHLK